MLLYLIFNAKNLKISPFFQGLSAENVLIVMYHMNNVNTRSCRGLGKVSLCPQQIGNTKKTELKELYRAEGLCFLICNVQKNLSYLKSCAEV